MRFRFVLDGATYSRNKDAFKAVLKRHGLTFRGSRDTFVWSSRSESVTAVFERDEARDLTVKAELAWQSRKKTALLNELKEWVWSVGGHGGGAGCGRRPSGTVRTGPRPPRTAERPASA